MNNFRADLHCHSTCSDGTFTPTEIVEMACKIGLQGLSITDHDSIGAYQEALPIAERLGLPMISGAEFSAMHNNTSVHILAYSFSLQSPIIQEFCAKHQQRRLKRNQAILNVLAKKGMPLSLEELYHTSKTVGRPHIALAMVEKGYVDSLKSAFQLYIGEGKSCYVTGESFSVEETLAVIHQAGGLAVIAHPHLIAEIGTVRDLLELPFDGIEGYYARFHRAQHERWIKIGEHRNLLITGGSDFHGAIKPTLPLGSSWVNEETFSILYQHFKQHQMK